MAHVGKYYPVHFRRDLSLNAISTSDVMPKTFEMVGIAFGGAGGADAYDLNGIEVPPYPDDKTWPPLWRSEEVTMHGRTFRIELRWDDFNDDESHIWLTMAITSGGADVYRVGWANSDNLTYYQFARSFGRPGFPFVDTAYWGGTFITTECQTHFVGW